MGGLPPKPPIGGRVASPKPPAKVFYREVRKFLGNIPLYGSTKGETFQYKIFILGTEVPWAMYFYTDILSYKRYGIWVLPSN